MSYFLEKEKSSSNCIFKIFKNWFGKGISEREEPKLYPSLPISNFIDGDILEHIRLFMGEQDCRKYIDEFNKTYLNLTQKLPDTQCFKRFNEKDIWRLLMDGDSQSYGPFGFDYDEPGYISALMDAFFCMLEGLGDKIDAESYIRLQSIAVSDVFDYETRQSFIKGLVDPETSSRDNSEFMFYNDDSVIISGYPFEIGKNASEDGVKEFEKKNSSNFESDRIIYRHCDLYDKNKGKMMHHRKNEVYYKKVIDSIFFDYYDRLYNLEIEKQNKNLSRSDYEDKILNIIISCCQNLDQLHAFLDGNIRTIVFLVLNKFLIENSLQPTIMRDPNVFDMKSVDEIIKEVVAGQEVFESYKKKH